VHVLTPLSLNLIPSTSIVVQGGFLGVVLFVMTEVGPWRPRTISWSVEKFQWTQFNSSFIWVNCSSFGPLVIRAEGYELEDKFVLNVEPKLVILSGDSILLPPISSMRIKVAHDLPCEFVSIREDLITCESDGVVKSGTMLGDSIILVKYGHQSLAVTVSVSDPSFLHVHQFGPADFQLMLLNPFGQVYHATSGVTYKLTGPEQFNTSIVNSSGYCRMNLASGKVVELKAAAYNTKFRLETEINVSVTMRIVPENPVLMVGAHLQLKCTDLAPNWSISDKSVAGISQDGIVSAKKPGVVRVYCSKAADTSLTSAELTDVELVNALGDDYEIRLGFSHGAGFNSNIVLPADVKFVCDWPVSSACGKVRTVVNASGRYCILNRTAKQHCPAQSRLKVQVSSASLKAAKVGEYTVSYYGQTDFGVPNEVRYTVSSTVRKVHVPVIVPADELKVVGTSKGLTVTFPAEGGVLIRAGRKFKSKGSAFLEHKKTGNGLTVHIVHEAGSADSGLLHHRQGFRQDLVFYGCLIVIFLSIFFIIIKVTDFSL
jgi:hypothetical protein